MRGPFLGARVAATAVTVAGVCVLATAAHATVATSDVMLDAVGGGLVLVDEEPGMGDSLTRTFRSREVGGRQLAITGFGVTTPPGVHAMFDALPTADVGVDVVPEPALDLAVWIVDEGGAPGDGGVSSLFVASRDHLFSITLVLEVGSTVDGPAFVLDVARRQVDAAGGPPREDDPPPARRVDDADLLPLLPDTPPPQYDLPWSTLTLTGANQLDTAGFDSPEAADFLNERARNAARVWGTQTLTVGVGLTQYPYEIFTAAALRGYADGEPTALPPARDALPPDAIAFREPEQAQIGVAFRRGDLLALVLVEWRGPITVEQATTLALDMAEWVAVGLPPGATSAYEFPSAPSRLVGLALTAVIVSAAVAGSRVIARVRAHLVRRRWTAAGPTGPTGPTTDWPSPTVPPAHVIELDDDAVALRRRGAVVGGAQVLSVNVGVVALAGDFAWAGVGVAAASLLAGLAFSRWWLRREYTLLGPAAPPRGFLVPRFWGAVTGVAAFVVLGVGVAYLLRGIRYLVFDPTLAHLRWSNLLGVAPRTVGVVFAVGGLVVAVLGAVLYRLARSLGRARVQRVLASDPRPPALYLRSFDDDRLPLPTIASARRPLFELFSLRGADPFEEAVAWELDSYGPVVAVGRPGGSLRSLGAAREHLADETWRDEIAGRMRAAGLVVLAPGETDGLTWELREIVRGRHLGKTLFVFPPLAPTELGRRWAHTSSLLREAGVGVGALPVPMSLVHTLRMDDEGGVQVTTASSRDEATYRAAVDRAVGPLFDTGDEVGTDTSIDTGVGR